MVICPTECHILEYLHRQLRIIYYNNPDPTALAVYIIGQKILWYRLDLTDNIINREIRITWRKRNKNHTFSVEYMGALVYSNYYNQETFGSEELPAIPPNYGYFDMESQLSSKFSRFVGLSDMSINVISSLEFGPNVNSQATKADEISTLNQWTNWLILAILIFLIIGIVIFIEKGFQLTYSVE